MKTSTLAVLSTYFKTSHLSFSLIQGFFKENLLISKYLNLLHFKIFYCLLRIVLGYNQIMCTITSLFNLCGM